MMKAKQNTTVESFSKKFQKNNFSVSAVTEFPHSKPATNKCNNTVDSDFNLHPNFN